MKNSHLISPLVLGIALIVSGFLAFFDDGPPAIASHLELERDTATASTIDLSEATSSAEMPEVLLRKIELHVEELAAEHYAAKRILESEFSRPQSDIYQKQDTVDKAVRSLVASSLVALLETEDIEATFRSALERNEACRNRFFRVVNGVEEATRERFKDDRLLIRYAQLSELQAQKELLARRDERLLKDITENGEIAKAIRDESRWMAFDYCFLRGVMLELGESYSFEHKRFFRMARKPPL